MSLFGTSVSGKGLRNWEEGWALPFRVTSHQCDSHPKSGEVHLIPVAASGHCWRQDNGLSVPGPTQSGTPSDRVILPLFHL